MNGRWKMNRIGFVNFWLYDEEDFEFADGKLLLRGQNGSGKSITTQSFIPFVLDGDRTPNRLDPFGSSDRRMEYYFLGEEGKDDVTGYLYLEFYHEEKKEYRTIGIGQRAKRGKPMDFWGFIVLDGRRIGYDLWLYKEVGSTKIPHDKKAMRAELGKENFFTDSQNEYKKHVNQYLFGFRKAEQYEQYIKLLVKVRAPKLSKEFKPTKVYEILNDSLQTLTDEDLRVMVDAMEKMDEIQDSLDLLNQAFSDVKKIRNEYTRYNQYMLAKKGQAYLIRKKAVEELQERLKIQEQKKRETEELLSGKNKRLTELEEQKQLAETEKAGLMDADLEEVDQKLERAKVQWTEAKKNEQRWEEKIQDCKDRLREQERQLEVCANRLEERLRELGEEKGELEEQQEILQWEKHQMALQIISAEEKERTSELTKDLLAWKRQLEECRKTIQGYEEICKQYDEISSLLEVLRKQEAEEEQRLEAAREQITDCMDEWIEAVYGAAKEAKEWHPEKTVLQRVEEKIREYQNSTDAGSIQEILRKDYEQQRQVLMDLRTRLEYEQKLLEDREKETKEQLQEVRNQEELEPERDANAVETRKLLEEAEIRALPFYKTVEFSDKLDEAACARLEAQLQKMGILDALVVSEKNFAAIGKIYPQFLDSVLHVEDRGTSGFSALTVNQELDAELQEAVLKILSNIYEKNDGSNRIYIGKDGSFCQGILTGRADKNGAAEYVGVLARKKRKEERIRKLQEMIAELQKQYGQISSELEQILGRVGKLQQEYGQLPDFSAINAALESEKKTFLELSIVRSEREKKQGQEEKAGQQKNAQYQLMLKQCRPFPYGRTLEGYEEAIDALEEYRRIWLEIAQRLFFIDTERGNCLDRRERIEQGEQELDNAFVEKRNYSTRRKELELQIGQYEDYLNRPDIVEKANRLKELSGVLDQIRKESEQLNRDLATFGERLRSLMEDEPKIKEHLQKELLEETRLKAYFEEELALGLVIERDTKTLAACAQEAQKELRDSDKNREPSELLQALNQVYLKNSGSLVSYGTSLEECFGEMEISQKLQAAAEPEIAAEPGAQGGTSAMRRRVRVVSVWNGKKVYLEEFYGILKAAIEETQMLIQKKDRELFEDILSQTISQQLTDRIAESRKWVQDMSQLMHGMDTSMGLSFSLDWKPCRAENDAELDTTELEQILLRDRALLTMEDIEKVASHFRSRIRMEKQKLEESNTTVNYMDLIRDALDYRKWFSFQMYFKRGAEQRKPLTNAAFNRFSGGEKAMAMYVPLFAAVNAQYQKADRKDHPRMIALDEAFAGVDDKNISSMFELVHQLDFDYIMNSQALWGCYETVKKLRIAELLRPQNSQTVSVIRYTWNGRERMLDEQ